MISAIELYGINELMLVPPIIREITTKTISEQWPRHIRFVFCGGAPLDCGSIGKLYGLLAPDACLAQVYGMTEAGWISTLKWPERDESGSVGKLLSNVEVR